MGWCRGGTPSVQLLALTHTTAHYVCNVHPKWHPIPYRLHYFSTDPYGRVYHLGHRICVGFRSILLWQANWLAGYVSVSFSPLWAQWRAASEAQHFFQNLMSSFYTGIVPFYTSIVLFYTGVVSFYTGIVSYHTGIVSYHTGIVSFHTGIVSFHTGIVSSHSIPVSSHSIPVSSHSIPVSSHSIPVSSHSIPVSSHLIPVLSHRPFCYINKLHSPSLVSFLSTNKTNDKYFEY
jgi:hypothetical protein